MTAGIVELSVLTLDEGHLPAPVRLEQASLFWRSHHEFLLLGEQVQTHTERLHLGDASVYTCAFAQPGGPRAYEPAHGPL